MATNDRRVTFLYTAVSLQKICGVTTAAGVSVSLSRTKAAIQSRSLSRITLRREEGELTVDVSQTSTGSH